MEGFYAPDGVQYNSIWSASPLNGVNFTIPQEGVVACLSKRRSLKVETMLGPRLKQWIETFSDEEQASIFAMITEVQQEQDACITLEKAVPTSRWDPYSLLYVTHHDPLFLHYEKHTRREIKIITPQGLCAVLMNIAKFLFYVYHQPSLVDTEPWEIDVKMQRWRMRRIGGSTPTWEHINPSESYLHELTEQIARPQNTSPLEEVPPHMVLGTGRMPRRATIGDAYSLQLVNKSTQDLYVWAFAFDLQSYAIQVSLQALYQVG